MAGQPVHITSRDNPLLQRLRKLAADPAAYRTLGAVWLEGDHLCRSLRLRGGMPAQAVLTEAAWGEPALRDLALAAPRVAVVPEVLFKAVSALESPAAIGYLYEPGEPPPIDPHAPSLVLDRVQDAGNVGSLLRSAAALGASQVLALRGTAALWSPKVLRAGMGAHFALRLIERLQPADLAILRVPLLATSPHATLALQDAAIAQPCAWVLSHEGQGVQADVASQCALSVRIPQPGGEESLNVAAAGAICLYASAIAAATGPRAGDRSSNLPRA